MKDLDVGFILDVRFQSLARVDGWGNDTMTTGHDMNGHTDFGAVQAVARGEALRPCVVLSTTKEIAIAQHASGRFIDVTNRMRASKNQADLLAARLLCTLTVADWLGINPRLVRLTQMCHECGSHEHGRPSVMAPNSAASVSWSHSRGSIAVACGPTTIGVDVQQRTSRPRLPTLQRSILTDNERQSLTEIPSPEFGFLILWTAKESLVKAGWLTLIEACEVDVSALLSSPTLLWQGWHLTSWNVRDAVGCAATRDPGLTIVNKLSASIENNRL